MSTTLTPKENRNYQRSGVYQEFPPSIEERLEILEEEVYNTSYDIEWSQDYYNKVYAKSITGITEYVRPADWLELPTLTVGQEKFVGLHAIYNHGSNFLALSAAGDYTIDWGDDVVENVSSGITAYHLYNYNNFSGQTESINGYKQAIITIEPQSGHTLTKIDLQKKHNQTGLQVYSSGWLDIKIVGSEINLMKISDGIVVVKHGMLEQFEFVGSNKITSTYSLFSGCYSLKKIVQLYMNNVTRADNMFFYCNKLETIPLLDTSNCTKLTNMFSYCYSLKTIPLLNTSKCTNFQSFFSSCESLKTIPLLDFSNGINLGFLFSSCISLETIPLIDASKATDLSSLFASCYSLQTTPPFKTNNATNFGFMFQYCYALKTISLIDTSKATNFSNMFNRCYSLRTIPLLNTSNVTNFGDMFNTCYALETIPLIDTSKGTAFNAMFYFNYSLKNVPLLNTSKGIDFSFMFAYCSSLKTIPPIDTSNGTLFNVMLGYSNSLETIPLLNTSKGTVFNSMFSNCYSLKTIPLLNTSKGTNLATMFRECHSLQTIPELVSSAATSSSMYNNMFLNSKSLMKAKLIGTKYSISYANCKLSADELEEIFNGLATVVGQTITITGNWGASLLTQTQRNVAINKGWTISG